MGEGFFVSLDSHLDGIASALGIQRALAEHRRHHVVPWWGMQPPRVISSSPRVEPAGPLNRLMTGGPSTYIPVSIGEAPDVRATSFKLGASVADAARGYDHGPRCEAARVVPATFLR